MDLDRVDLSRVLARRVNRRGFFRMAGLTTVGAAALAACKKADSGGGGGGGTTGTTGGAVVHPPLEQEPGGLQVFDWGGYGDGAYYPDKERNFFWQQYVDATGDTPEFVLFENDDIGFTKVAAGARYDVIHHSQLLADLVRSGRLSPAREVEGSATFHDPCYLGRHNGEYEAGRSVLASLPGLASVEMPRNRDRAFCCGAGGGGNWVEVRQGQRIASLRMAEARATGASVVATACPFCTIMLEGEIAGQGMTVRDVAELLLESQAP